MQHNQLRIFISCVSAYSSKYITHRDETIGLHRMMDVFDANSPLLCNRETTSGDLALNPIRPVLVSFDSGEMVWSYVESRRSGWSTKMAYPDLVLARYIRSVDNLPKRAAIITLLTICVDNVILLSWTSATM